MSTAQDIDCEVYVDHAWRPGLLVSLARDGWGRVLVDCYGKIRELTFSPRTLRFPPDTTRTPRG